MDVDAESALLRKNARLWASVSIGLGFTTSSEARQMVFALCLDPTTSKSDSLERFGFFGLTVGKDGELKRSLLFKHEGILDVPTMARAILSATPEMWAGPQPVLLAQED